MQTNDDVHQWKAFDGAISLPRPNSCTHMADFEYHSSVVTMVHDLYRLAKQDGCIAAAWALDVFAALSDTLPQNKMWDELAPLVKKMIEQRELSRPEAT